MLERAEITDPEARRQQKLFVRLYATVTMLIVTADLIFNFSISLWLMLDSHLEDEISLVILTGYIFVLYMIVPFMLARTIEKWLHRRRHRHDRGVGDSAPQS